MRRYGEEGARLWRLARGIDDAPVDADARDQERIGGNHLRPATSPNSVRWSSGCGRRPRRSRPGSRRSELAGSTVTLKLKTADFRIRTRARSLGAPTQLAGKIFAAGRDCCGREIGGTRYRLIGIGVSHLADAEGDDMADLIDRRRAEAEHAIDRLREKFGKDAVVKGLALDDD